MHAACIWQGKPSMEDLAYWLKSLVAAQGSCNLDSLLLSSGPALLLGLTQSWEAQGKPCPARLVSKAGKDTAVQCWSLLQSDVQTSPSAESAQFLFWLVDPSNILSMYAKGAAINTVLPFPHLSEPLRIKHTNLTPKVTLWSWIFRGSFIFNLGH